MSKHLWLYQKLEYWGWPKSYVGKFVLLTIITLNIPLLFVFGSLIWSTSSLPKTIIFGAILGTLIGMIILILGLRQLLQPVVLATQSLQNYFETREILPLPSGFQDEAGVLLSYIAQLITHFDRKHHTNNTIALADPITGLLNRAAAEERLRQSLCLAYRHEIPIAIALINIDHFCQIYQEFGGDVSDQVIALASHQLQQSVRASDWVATWDENKFLMVLFTKQEGCQIALERVRQQLAQLSITVEEKLLTFTVSIGFTMVKFNEHLWPCLERANNALTLAKENGRNRVEYCQVS